MARKTRRTTIGEPTELCSILRMLISQRKWDRRLNLHKVFDFWDEVVGREIANRAQPVFIRGKVLWVTVVDSIWMQQLHLQKILLLERINRRSGKESLTDIRFKLNTSPSRPPTPEKIVKPDSRPPDKKKLHKFEDLTSFLRQDDTRTALRELWIKFHSTP